MNNPPTLLERAIEFLRATGSEGNVRAQTLCEEIEERAKTAFTRERCGVAQLCTEDRGLIDLGRKLTRKEKKRRYA